LRASEASYLAGFFDGDGSIHFQLVRQKGYRFGFYIRASMSLSQSTTARSGLEHLQVLIGAGYLRDRGTGMSDLVITSRPLLTDLLRRIEPFVLFKREHVRRALWLLPQIRSGMSAEEFLRVAREVDAFASLNHSKTKRISAADAEQHLRDMGMLAPVTTHSHASASGWDFAATRRRGIYESHNTPAPGNRVKV
jgi:LAGLIDADG DNA endonuclease family protein